MYTRYNSCTCQIEVHMLEGGGGLSAALLVWFERTAADLTS